MFSFEGANRVNKYHHSSPLQYFLGGHAVLIIARLQENVVNTDEMNLTHCAIHLPDNIYNFPKITFRPSARQRVCLTGDVMI